MEFLTFITFILIIIKCTAQNRGLIRRRHNHGSDFGHFHWYNRFRPLPTTTAAKSDLQHYEDPVMPKSYCQQIQFLKILKNRLYGSLTIEDTRSIKGLNVVLEFDQTIIGFINDFSPSNSHDNQIFVLNDDAKTIGKNLQINFLVKHNELSPPDVKRIIVNGDQICPVESKDCVELEISNTDRETFEGVLIIYSNQYARARKIIFSFNSNLLAFANDFGYSRTIDQKNFTVDNFYDVDKKQPIVINFLVKFDQFENTPILDQLYVDDVSVCISRNNLNNQTLQFPTVFSRKESTLLDSLPFNLFPNITFIPENINNDGYECGLSESIPNFKTDGESFKSWQKVTKVGQFPFHVAIFFQNFYRCAGSLITERITLTAAHCVVNSEKNVLPKDKFDLLFGCVDLLSLTGNESLRKVSKIIRHPDYYDYRILKQDIALVFANGSLQFSYAIRPVCLSRLLLPMTQSFGNQMTVLGFRSSDIDERQKSLYFGNMTIISRDECTEKIIFALLPEESTFCARSRENTLCPGDSGGGIVQTINSKFYLRGVASMTIMTADEKCDGENPVGFTDIYAFNTWIYDNLNNSSVK